MSSALLNQHSAVVYEESRPPAPLPLGNAAFPHAVQHSTWQHLYTDREALDADDWIEDYPHSMDSRQFTWGTTGWKVDLRCTDDPGDALVLVTLHGQVADVWFEIPVEEAVAIFEDIEDTMAHVLSRSICVYAQRAFLGEVDCAPGWFLDLIDARWRYQAFAGVHVDVVNAVLAYGPSSTDLYKIATTTGAERTGYLQRYFHGSAREQAPPWFPRIEALNSPFANLATPEEQDRLMRPTRGIAAPLFSRRERDARYAMSLALDSQISH